MNALLAEAARTAVRGREVRVLEVGGGSGSATASVLPALAGERVAYVFTDVSPFFTTQAREKLQAFPFVEFALLNMTLDLEAQGFRAQDFDLIIAANVVHVAPDLKQAVERLQKLLKPGGSLLLLEATEPRRWTDLIFGMTAGWWQFEDADLRPSHALLSPSAWKDLLTSCGFASCELTVPERADVRLLSGQAIVRGTLAGAAVSHRCVVAEDRSGIASALAEEDIDPGADKVLFFGGTDGSLREALKLTQFILTQESANPRQLWLVTRGAYSGEASGVHQAALWGFGKTLRREHPELRCRSVDLDPASNDVEPLREELRRGGDEPEVMFRGGRRLVSRLHRVVGGRSVVNPVSPEGRYVVTGGVGGIGLKMAHWLISKGARDLLLLGRTAPAGVALTSLEALQKRALVRFAACDVSDLDQLASVLRRDDVPLRGVVHAAGTFEDRVVREHRWEFFERVFPAKVRGAWNLHELTKDTPLDLFLLMSSASTLLGGAGMSNYVASNCAVDALAHYRRAHGMPALSVNWGLWADTGMAVTAGESRNRQWAEQGLAPMDADTALEALDLAVASGLPQCAVLALDWPRFLAQFPAGAMPAEFEDFKSAAVASARVESLRQKLQGKAAPEQSALLTAHVREEAARVLGVAQAASIDIRQGFFELGMDSLTSMELRNRLQDAVGMPLPPTIAFRHSTVETLAQALLAGLRDAPAATESGPEEDALADMDLAGLEALLDQKLEALD